MAMAMERMGDGEAEQWWWWSWGYTLAFLGPGLKKPELKFLGPSLAWPDLWAYKLGPNPVRTTKSPAWTRLNLRFLQARAWPGPTFGLQNQARTWPDVQAWPRPARNFRAGLPMPRCSRGYHLGVLWCNLRIAALFAAAGVSKYIGPFTKIVVFYLMDPMPPGTGTGTSGLRPYQWSLNLLSMSLRPQVAWLCRQHDILL